MSANILWLHDLRLTDLAQVGGKNSSLGEMIGELAGLGVSVPGGFATTADAFKAFIAHNDLHQRIFDRLAVAGCRGRRRAARAGGEIRGWVDRRAAAAGTRRGHPQRLSPAVRRQRCAATSPSPCAPRPPRKTCRMRPSPASRKPSSTSPASTTCLRKVKRSLRHALQRPRHRLSRAPGLQARGRVPVRRRAADGALATSAPPA